MIDFLRLFPHPTYGKCGGAKRDCSIKPPIDWMDIAFAIHDNDLFSAKDYIDRRSADNRLAKRLREGDPKKLSLYGRFYRRLAMLVFK